MLHLHIFRWTPQVDASGTWEIFKNIKVRKVFQDDPHKDVFKDDNEIFYATPRQLKVHLPMEHTSIIERLKGHANHIKDT